MTQETEGAAAAAAEDTSAAVLAAEDTTTGAEQQDGAQPGDDAAAAADAAGEGQGQPPKKSAQDRIDELTRARRDAEREAAYWRGKAEGSQPAGERQPERQEEEDAEPNPDDYRYGETDPGFIKALGAFTARKEFERLTAESTRRTQVQTVETTWAERQQAFAKEKPDFFEVYDREWVCTRAMAAAIKTSDEGAAVAYHLASNPEEARRIAGLDTLSQVRELGKLEAKLAPPAGSSEPPPKTVSDAPPPNPQLRGQGGKYKVSPDTDDFASFEKQYG